MTISSSMVTPRYYVASDTYYYATCNRPLVDLATNVASLAYYLDLINLGYQGTVCVDKGTANALNPVNSTLPAAPVLQQVYPLAASAPLVVSMSAGLSAALAINPQPPIILTMSAGLSAALA